MFKNSDDPFIRTSKALKYWIENIVGKSFPVAFKKIFGQGKNSREADFLL